MAHYTITVNSNPGTVFSHSGGDLEVIISATSDLRAAGEVLIQYETTPASGVYETLPGTNLKYPQTAIYQLSACNVKAVLTGGDAGTIAKVRLVSVA